MAASPGVGRWFKVEMSTGDAPPLVVLRHPQSIMVDAAVLPGGSSIGAERIDQVWWFFSISAQAADRLSGPQTTVIIAIGAGVIVVALMAMHGASVWMLITLPLNEWVWCCKA